jgi:hypothetical protein
VIEDKSYIEIFSVKNSKMSENIHFFFFSYCILSDREVLGINVRYRKNVCTGI